MGAADIGDAGPRNRGFQSGLVTAEIYIGTEHIFRLSSVSILSKAAIHRFLFVAFYLYNVHVAVLFCESVVPLRGFMRYY